MFSKSDERSTHDRILDAAMQLFAELPYEEIQMDLVAQRARVAKPTLYRYFKAKESLFLTALDAFLSDFSAAVAQIADAPGAPKQALGQIMEVAFDRFAGCTAALRAVDGSDAGLGISGRLLARSRVEDIRRSIEHVLHRGVAVGEFNDPDPNTTALILLGALRLAGARTPASRRSATLRRIQAVIFDGVALTRRASSSSMADAAQELENL